MATTFDRRVVPDSILALIRRLQDAVPCHLGGGACHLGGGAALAGAHLRHRTSRDVDLELALRKDVGIDPGVLAWLLSLFPVEPLPTLLSPLTTDELRAYRDELRERMRLRALPHE